MIPAYLYSTVFTLVALLLCIISSLSITDKNYKYLSYNEQRKNHLFLFLLVIVLSFYIGLRPSEEKDGLGDTCLYALQYDDTRDSNKVTSGGSDELGFKILMNICRPFFDVSGYFTVVALLYFGCVALAMKRILRGNAMIGFLFFIGSFSTFSYATNGIRNGLACSILTLAIVMIALNKNMLNYIISFIIAFIALSIHKTTMLPIACLILSLYIKNIKVVYIFWFLSILIFITFGNTVGSMFASLGFDDRMSSYFNSTSSYALSNKTGFRIDFIIYSAMPMWLGYYAIFKRKVCDNAYRILLSTYILANSFWVMIMNISFSNRFAYLSWFLYPVVLAYPCMKLNIWGDRQGCIASRILMCNVLFTAFMEFIYY